VPNGKAGNTSVLGTGRQWKPLTSIVATHICQMTSRANRM
jgi:hypothetical protein